MPGRIEVDLHVTDVINKVEAVEVITKGITHLQAVIEMIRLDKIDDANTAMGNALSCIDEVQDFLDRTTGQGGH